MQLRTSEVSSDYYSRPPGIVSLLMLTITYEQAMALQLHIHNQGSFHNHTVHTLYRIMVMTLVSWLCMKIGNIALRAEFKPTFLAFWASVLPLHHIGSLISALIPTPTCFRSFLPQRPVQTYYKTNGWGKCREADLYNCLAIICKYNTI